ncbi:MAG TPA: NAD(P)H-hydrate dehydratase [Acidimicrobiales bacterium]|nr:NAD(P)H-hydrate dehydratase [Acidimicrobiales bacterium]
MIPVLTPEEMAGVDRQAPEPVEVLIARAGASVAKTAARLLGGAYRKQVTVVAGKGNNGADGRAAAQLLSARGARVEVLEAADLAPGQQLERADLVVDAAYGTGLQRAYQPPAATARVLAVDIPSGLNGTTGEAPEGGDALNAVATVTFASLKPGLLLARGPQLSGAVEVADIGLGDLVGSTARCFVVEDADAVRWLPPRPHEAHKWQSAVQVVAGSPGMTGAPWFVSRSALRSGAGYVRLSMPGVSPSALPPSELVHLPVPESGWHEEVLAGISRVKALVVGPGLGPVARSTTTAGGDLPGGEVGLLLAGAGVPAVVDADGLNAIGTLDALAAIVSRRQQATVITPHEGELTRLAGAPPGADRLAAVRAAAARSGAIVLLKGSTTVVAAPDGQALMCTSGGPRLATAGTGDVLSGLIGALIARGVPALQAAGLGAHVHGRAADRGFGEGLVAGDLPDLVAAWLSGLPGR